MFPVNCPKTRNEEFGQLLEALTEKYCQTVMKLDELIGQFDTLKDKNDKVIKFQDENFSKHDNGIEDVVAQHRWENVYETVFFNIFFRSLVSKQQEDHQLVMKRVEEENEKLRKVSDFSSNAK